jgi:hypothetical protein
MLQKRKKRSNLKIGGHTDGTWKKGIPSPNPSGRPKLGETWKELIERIGREETITDDGEKVSWREKVVRAAYKNACSTPTPSYWKELMDRSGEETPPEEMLNRLAEKYNIPKEELAKDAGIIAILGALSGAGSAS